MRAIDQRKGLTFRPTPAPACRRCFRPHWTAVGPEHPRALLGCVPLVAVVHLYWVPRNLGFHDPRSRAARSWMRAVASAEPGRRRPPSSSPPAVGDLGFGAASREGNREARMGAAGGRSPSRACMRVGQGQ